MARYPDELNRISTSGNRGKNDQILNKLAGYILAFFTFTYGINITIGYGAVIPVSYGFMIIFVVSSTFSKTDYDFLIRVYIVILIIFCLQLAIGLPNDALIIRIILGNFLIIFSVFGCSKLLDLSSRARHLWLFQGLRVLLWIQVGVQIVKIVLIGAGLATGQEDLLFGLPRSGGLATEASHVAVILAPLTFMAVMAPQRFRQLMGQGSSTALWLSTFVLGASATSFAVLGLAGVIRLTRMRNGVQVLISLIAIVVTMSAGILLVPAVNERILGTLLLIASGDTSTTSNVSVLVFAKGAELASIALRHYPLGVGALDLRALAPYSQLNQIFPVISDLNNDDGSSLLFKGIGEFGYLYIALLILIVVQLARRLRQIDASDVALFEAACLFSVVASSIRGTTYFGLPATVGLSVALRSALVWRARPSDRKQLGTDRVIT